MGCKIQIDRKSLDFEFVYDDLSINCMLTLVTKRMTNILDRMTAFTSPVKNKILSLQVDPLGHPLPWLFRESHSCVVGLVAWQSTE